MKRVWHYLLIGAASVSITTGAQAVVVNWTDWTSATTAEVVGDLAVDTTSVTVTYSGPYEFVQTGTGTNFWTEGDPAPYTGGSVENAPPASELIALNAGGSKTITFSQAVQDPYIALISWNGNVVEFDSGIELISEGRGFWGVGTADLNDASTGFTGLGEVHGIIRFSGSFTEINFTDTSENWHGFTVGVAGLGDGGGPIDTPEPAALGILGLGILGIAGIRRRKSA